MITTDSFVMINYPKTGSSFARKVIKDLYATLSPNWLGRPYCREFILPNVRHPGVSDQHGCYSQIPWRYRRHPVMSVVRNPYDRFLSLYEFRHWAYHPLISEEELADKFPTFPNLTMDEYVDLYQMEHGSVVGPQTYQFLQLFGRKLPGTFTRPPSLQAALSALADITYLRQEHLNRDLIGFLDSKGFSADQTDFIRVHERVNVTASIGVKRETLWTPKALKFIAETEYLLFQILDAKGICYHAPRAMAA